VLCSGRLGVVRLLGCVLALGVGAGSHAEVPLELLRVRVNSAIAAPAGEGLSMLYAAEPLGKGRFRAGSLNHLKSVTVPDLGPGNSYTGQYSLGYGLTSNIDVSVVVPFLMDSAGGLNKYGTGDPVIGIKYATPADIEAGFHTAYQLMVGLGPLGYKGVHGLDREEYDGGIRAFSNESIDLGLQVLLDAQISQVSLYLNGGYFRSGNAEVLPELVYGMGMEVGRRSRWGSVNAEYWTRVAFAEESQGAAVLKFGLRGTVLPGVELELNRERGFLDHPGESMFSFGLRLHGHLTGGRKLANRSALYKPPPLPRQLYAPDQVLRIAVVEFAGYQSLEAGARVVEQLRDHLAPHDSLEVVDLTLYADVPYQGFLSPAQAIRLARKLGVDVVITGEVEEYEVSRYNGSLIPHLLRLTEATVGLRLRYRVIEFSADKTELQAHIGEVQGRSRLKRRVQLLPAGERDITRNPSSRELEAAQDRAFSNLATNMLGAMAARFTWVPPEFQR
jgi:hypothetical protein